MDSARSCEGKMKPWVCVEEFLVTLGGENAKKLEIESSGGNGETAAGSKTCVNHFIQWYRKLSKCDLEILAKRRAGCILPRNQDGADMLIPFWIDEKERRDGSHDNDVGNVKRRKLVEKSDEKMQDRDINNDERHKFGMIVIQVKNCIRHEDMRVVGYKLERDYIFDKDTMAGVPTMRIVMELGLRRDKDGQSQLKGEIVKVNVNVNDGEVQTSNSQVPKTIQCGSAQEACFSFLRLKGIDSIEFLKNNDKKDVRTALKELLRGPIQPTKWWEDYKNVGKTSGNVPEYDLHLSSICLGEEKSAGVEC
mmetsp:Transcript_20488/g.31244  ORF Transcript_20488/g.31244 Transcript_20488/m.31244 type:complete len:307 (+) Transcript_20488:1-921(+)